jgi:cytochrome c
MKPSFELSLKALLALTLTTFCFSAHAVDADAAKAFAKQNNCLRCHGVDKAKDGPAFNSVAAKYKGNADAEAKLLKHLSSGEPAKFPDGHTEAHMILKSDDAAATKNLVDWILSL